MHMMYSTHVYTYVNTRSHSHVDMSLYILWIHGTHVSVNGCSYMCLYICINESCPWHTHWMGYGTHVNGLCHTYKWVISQIWINHLYTNDSWPARERVIAHTLNEAWHSCELVVSHISMSHFLHINESCLTHVVQCIPDSIQSGQHVLSIVLQRVAACCSVLQRVAVCCSVLQRVAACCSVLQRVAVCCSVVSHGPRYWNPRIAMMQGSIVQLE